MYNIFRYGSLPFTGLFRNAASAVSHVSNFNPNISPTINVNYPNISMPESSSSSSDIFTQTLGKFLDHPTVTLCMVGLFALKFFRK
jgi:hypothetical protein